MDKWGVQDQMYFWRDISTAPLDERILGANSVYSFEMYYSHGRWLSIGDDVMLPKWWMPMPRPPGGGLNDDWEDDKDD